MVKSLLSVTLASLGAMTCANAFAADLVKVSGYEPAEGLQEQLGAVILTFAEQPSANEDCAEVATLQCDETILNVASTSSAVQTEAWDLNANQARITFSSKAITESGDYLMSVPEGFFTFENGGVSEALTVSYKIGNLGEVMINPTPGYPKEMPTEVKITFVGAVNLIDNHVTPDSEGLGAIRWDTPLATVQLNEDMDEMTIEGGTVTFKMYDTPPTEPGEYRLTIYAGAMSVVYPDGKTATCGKVEANYVLPRIPRPAITPAEGNVYELGDIVLTLEEGCTYGQFMRPPSLFTDPGEARVESWAIMDKYPRGLNEIHLSPANGKAITTPGKYRFKIGKASFSAVGPNYSVDKPGEVAEGWNGCDYYYDFTILPSPAEGKTDLENPCTVSALSFFNVYYPGALSMEVNPEFTGSAELRDQYWREIKGYTVDCKIIEPETDEDVYTVAVEITPAIEKDGYYSVYLPDGMFICNGSTSSRSVLQNFNVDVASGVLGVEEAATVDVYSIEGLLVKANATEADIEALPAGLYIAGGRKIYKK